jgi:PAS domain S-box-containing protein
VSVARLFDLAPDLLCVAGTDGYFKRVNAAFERTLGYGGGDLLGSPFVDLVHPDDVAATLGAISQLEHGRQVTDFENRYRASDGSWRWLEWRAQPSDDGRYIYACARDVTDERCTLAIAQERGEIVARQSADLARLDLIHRTMTQAVADGATAADVLGSVAELTRKPVALFGAAFNLVQTVADGDAARRWPIEGAAAQVRRVLAGGGEARPSAIVPPMPAHGVNTRHLVGRIAARGEDIGYLVVAEVGSPLSAFDTQVVEHSSIVLSLELVASRRQHDAESQAREDFLADLLQGDRDPERLRRRSTAYGVDLGTAHALVRVGWDPDTHQRITGSARRAYLQARLGDHLAAAPIAVGVPGADVFLCRLQEIGGREAMEQLRTAVVAALDSSGLRRASRASLVSGACAEIGDYADAHRDLRAVMESMDGFGPGHPVALLGDLGVLRRFLTNGLGGSARRFANELLAPLVERDRAGSDLVSTLRTFLDEGASFRRTATALGVHENTVRYRLNQIREVTSIDPDDLDSLLDVRFALRALELD